MYINLAIFPLYGGDYSYYQYIFIITLVTLAIILMLKSSIYFIIQVAMLFSWAMMGKIDNSMFTMMFAVVQISFSLWSIYKLKLAIDYNYQLVLEKTHQTKRIITENDYTGTRKSF